MVVDVVLASNLAIGDHVDTRSHLVGDHLGGCPHERRLGVLAGRLHLVGPATRVVAVRQVEPVRDRHVLRLGVGTDDGRRQASRITMAGRVGH